MVKTKESARVQVAKMFITAGGELFSSADLKRFEIPSSKQIDKDVPWGAQIIEPPYDLQKLMKWIDISVVHSSCVRAKVQDAFGVGFKLKEREDKGATDEQYDTLYDFFSKCNEKESITEVSKKVGLDWETCGNGYFEAVREVIKAPAIKALYHINATTIRLCKDKERYVQMKGNRKVFFKLWGDERPLNKDTGNFVKVVDPDKEANEIIPLKQYSYLSPFYGMPEWLPASFQMFAEMKEREYNIEFFSSHGIPAYAVILEGAKMETDAKDLVKQYFEKEVKGNPHRTMVFSTPAGSTLKFERLSVQQKEASFRIYRKDNRDDVLTVHHVPPYRASIVEKGALGGSVAEPMDRIYLDSVINPRQRVFAWVMSDLIIREGFEIEGYEFVYDDIDIRDKEAQSNVDGAYFNMGARTPNQILVEQGLDPYDGGDIYYVPSSLVQIGIDPEPLFKGATNVKLPAKPPKDGGEEGSKST